MKKYFKHFYTITKHKWYVGIECWRRGLYWQGIIHDLSKYSFTEFFVSAKYFEGDNYTVRDKSGYDINYQKRKRVEKEYSIAWLNHKAKNKHHWIYWTDMEDGEWIAVSMPDKYIKEMVCDFIGAGKAYNLKNYTPEEPWNYYKNVECKKMLLTAETRKRFEELLIEVIK